jgi:hypothetical protein
MLVKAMDDLCDEHDIEGYGEFLRMSKGLGDKRGYQLIRKAYFNMDIENPTKESQKIISDFQSQPIHLMVRPKKGTTFVGLRDSAIKRE